MRVRLALAALLLCLTPLSARAWWATGHMVTAEIAYERLSDKTKAECDRLIAVPVDPANVQARSNTFVTSAAWADDAKRALNTGTWHYFDIAFSDDGTSSTLVHDKMNLVTAMTQCTATLRDPAAADKDKATALRYMIHFMGDIHQPLHCSARVTKEHSAGDQGGNLFEIKTTLGTVYNGNTNYVKQLHSLWDSGCGLMKDDPHRPLDAAGLAMIESLAKDFAETNPPKEKARKIEPFMDLCREGYELSRAVVYDGLAEHSEPSADYMERGQKTVGEQVALGGYRLANLLNGIFDPAAPLLPKE